MALLPQRARARGLKADESTLFIPGYARIRADGQLEVNIHAWIFEFERRPGARTAFLKLLDVDLDAAPPEARGLFQDRSRWFLTDSERGKVLEITFDGDPAPVTLAPSNRAGRVDARVLRAGVPDGGIRFHISRQDGSAVFAGIAHFVPETGLSIVSDIDDTIKISNVAETRTLLRDSLIKRFDAVPGMAALYRRLARETGTAFHYLSSSPIQLLPALLDFLEAKDFPAGSMHLRESTAWNSLIPGGDATRAHKEGVLTRILADFPARRFLLIGDSGEQDPEIYGNIARAHPDRDISVLIRVASGADASEARFDAAFAGLAPEARAILPADPQDAPF